ncbi:MAG: hypothetical protein GAK28_00283 [Luteibacter sp.]|nr:MAG: hypothetical protein GAK28_00283 [Luteibacter sp.]
MTRIRTRRYRAWCMASFFALGCSGVIATPCPPHAEETFRGECSLLLKNGDFTELRNVGTRALRWSHLAYWSATDRYNNLGIEHDGRWGSVLPANGHAIWQELSAMDIGPQQRGNFALRFAVANLDAPGGTLSVGLLLFAPNGDLLESRGMTVVPDGSPWRDYALGMRVSSVPEGARLKVVFRRDGNKGGKRLAVSSVSLHQLVGDNLVRRADQAQFRAKHPRQGP